MLTDGALPDGWKGFTLSHLADLNPDSLGEGAPRSLSFDYIDLSAVSEGRIDWSKVHHWNLRSAPSRARRVVRMGDVLFGTVRPALRSHGYIDKASSQKQIASTGFCVLRAKKDVAAPRYLFHLVLSDLIGSQARRSEVGSNYPAVNEGDIAKFGVLAPAENEQRHIAHILDTVDAAIEQTERLIAKLRMMKQGLIHDLLTRGIDESGRLRNPDYHPHQFKNSEVGMVPADWIVAPLGTQFSLQRGFDIIEAEQRSGDVPVVSSSGITSYHDTAMVNKPGVVIGRKGKLGDAYFIEEPFWPHDTTLWVKDFHGNDPEFASLFLQWLRLERFDAATSVPTLNRNFIHPLPIGIPPPQEQRAITSVVHHLSDKLKAEEGYRNKLLCLCLGLMADLLTGRVRVKMSDRVPA